MTEWRDVPGYEGHYQVSTDGKVRSLERTTLGGCCKKGRLCEKRWPSKVLVPHVGRDGIPRVKLSNVAAGKVRRVYVHTLVREVFGPQAEKALKRTIITFRPTHRHAEGGIYQVISRAVRVQIDGEWNPAVLYRDRDGFQFVRTRANFVSRFTALKPGEAA